MSALMKMTFALPAVQIRRSEHDQWAPYDGMAFKSGPEQLTLCPESLSGHNPDMVSMDDLVFYRGNPSLSEVTNTDLEAFTIFQESLAEFFLGSTRDELRMSEDFHPDTPFLSLIRVKPAQALFSVEATARLHGDFRNAKQDGENQEFMGYLFTRFEEYHWDEAWINLETHLEWAAINKGIMVLSPWEKQ